MVQEFRIFRALGLSFTVWFRNFFPITLLAGLLYAPVFFWVATADLGASTDLDHILDVVFIKPIYALVGLSALLSPLLTYRVVQDLNGTKVSMLTSIKLGLRGIVPAVVLAVVTNLVQLIPLGGILGAIITCYWFVAAPAAVAERLGPFAAFSRSSVLTQGRRGGIFGLTFLIGLALIGLLAVWIVPMFSREPHEIMEGLRTSALMFVATMAVFQTFSGIAQAVSYALLRQDKDGVSHEDLARVFE